MTTRNPQMGFAKQLATTASGLVASLVFALPAATMAQPASPEVQVLTLVAQAEHIDSKCSAFSIEGQFVYREMKSRMLNSFNAPLLASISERIAPEFAGSCKDLAQNPNIRERVTYFNNLGEHMLALHHFLPAGSTCHHVDTPQIKARAAAAWKKRQARVSDPVSAEAMQREAAVVENFCSTLGWKAEPSAHLATAMSRSLNASYQRGPKYGGEMDIKGNHTEIVTPLIAFRDPARMAIKGGTIAGEFQELAPATIIDARLAILTDGRLAVMMLAENGKNPSSVSFKGMTAEYKTTRLAPADPAYSSAFVLDQTASKALLSQEGLQPTFTIKFWDKDGSSSFWQEAYSYQGRRKDDRGTSVRPLRFDPVAFRNALQYSNAPKF